MMLGENLYLIVYRKDVRSFRDWVGDSWVDIDFKFEIFFFIFFDVSSEVKFFMFFIFVNDVKVKFIVMVDIVEVVKFRGDKLDFLGE